MAQGHTTIWSGCQINTPILRDLREESGGGTAVVDYLVWGIYYDLSDIIL